jgi:CDP-paratose 2-epimerase
MIEQEYRDWLGVSQHFSLHDETSLDNATRLAQTLGLRQFRASFTPAALATDAGRAWCVEVLSRLAPECEVLPSFEISDAAALAAFLPELAGYCRAIEIASPADALAEMIPMAAASGLKTCLQVSSAEHLEELDRAGLLEQAHAIGVSQDHAELLHARADCEIWITRAGYSTWRHDECRQAQALLDAIHLRPARLYWNALFDVARHAAATYDEANAGLFDHAGQPKLAARLLANGVAGLDRILTLARRLHTPAIVGKRPILVTGGAGFIGANLADRLASEGHSVLLFDALARTGVERNLLWLTKRHPTRISFELGDIRDETAITDAARRASAVFHLAGQVAVTTSMTYPTADFSTNAAGTLTLLEALRLHNPEAPLIFASTNKVYGDLADIPLAREGDRYLPVSGALRAAGISESRPLCFHTPYGCSKGTADQYVLDYAHSFGLRTAVLRMSCIYGERQLGTEDQGWVAHFLLRAIAGEGLTIYGDGHQVRDVLHVGDAVSAYTAAWAQIDRITGRAFNLGGGPANAISLVQLVAYIEQLLGRQIPVEFSDWRPGDQRYFVADTTAIRRTLGLPSPLGWQAGLGRLAEHFGAVLARGGNAQTVEALT